MVSKPEMAMKVLIGYDGYECADAAIRGLQRAGLPAKAEATVLSAADLLTNMPYADFGSPNSPLFHLPAVQAAQGLAQSAMADAKQAAARGADLVASLFPGWTVQSSSVADSPYWALVKKAEEWPADLVVVGSHGRSVVGRVFLGSVSQNVLHHSPCSVRIGRRREGAAPDEGAPVRVLLAIDGSPDSAVAAEVVGARNWPAGTEVRVVTAVDVKTSVALLGFGEWVAEAEHGRDLATIAQFRVRAVAKALGEQGVMATPVALEGDPKRVVPDEAERWRADCIFLGAKGHSRLDRFLLGSVSSAVATRAHCTVEVVRRR